MVKTLDNVKVELKKGWFPIWCEKCDQLGYIFVNDLKHGYYIICSTCGWETSQVYCPKCDMGGSFIDPINHHPSSWTCTDCKTEYHLPRGFYENPTDLISEEKLPKDVLDEIVKRSESNRITSPSKMIIAGAIFYPLILGSLIGPCAILYWFWSQLSEPQKPIGLLITWILGAVWLFLWRKLNPHLLKIYFTWRDQNL